MKLALVLAYLALANADTADPPTAEPPSAGSPAISADTLADVNVILAKTQPLSLICSMKPGCHVVTVVCLISKDDPNATITAIIDRAPAFLPTRDPALTILAPATSHGFIIQQNQPESLMTEHVAGNDIRPLALTSELVIEFASATKTMRDCIDHLKLQDSPPPIGTPPI